MRNVIKYIVVRLRKKENINQRIFLEGETRRFRLWENN